VARGHQITERDLKILCFLTRYGAATAEQVRREFFCGSVKAAYRRLRALQGRGMVRGERVFYEMPGVYRVTERGARLAGVGLPPPRRDLPRLHHTLEVLELSWRIRSRDGVVEWVAEREIRRDKLAARRERHTGRMTAGTGAGRTPDGIAILKSTEEVAVELELSFKRAAGYRSIFSDYEAQVASGEVDGIWFYVASPKALQRVRELSERHRSLDGRLSFGLYEPVFGRGP
jgi:hypothetical protein